MARKAKGNILTKRGCRRVLRRIVDREGGAHTSFQGMSAFLLGSLNRLADISSRVGVMDRNCCATLNGLG
jgi:hypothetical protein